MFIFRFCRQRTLFSLKNQCFGGIKTCPSMWNICFDRRIASKPSAADLTNNLNAVSKHDEFDNETLEGLKTKMKLFDKIGIGRHYVRQYPQLLSVREDHLVSHTKLMREIKLEEDAIVEMLLSKPELVRKCYLTCRGDLKRSAQHRIHFISQELKISQKELCHKLFKYRFVLSLSLTRIKSSLKVLLGHGTSPAAIWSDFWVIRCKPTKLAERLEQVKDVDVDDIKPWMGRCEDLAFECFINRASSKQKMLGELSLEEYISQRLGRSAQEIKEIIVREPELQKTSVLKIKKILDFLFSSGFSPSHILAGLPRVANRRIETIHTRLLEMNHEGIPPSIYVLCKSQREYQYYINKRKKRET